MECLLALFLISYAGGVVRVPAARQPGRSSCLPAIVLGANIYNAQGSPRHLPIYLPHLRAALCGARTPDGKVRRLAEGAHRHTTAWSRSTFCAMARSFSVLVIVLAQAAAGGGRPTNRCPSDSNISRGRGRARATSGGSCLPPSTISPNQPARAISVRRWCWRRTAF